MFFDNPDNEIRILSVLSIDRGASHAMSPDRPFHALSLRLSGGADFSACEKSIHAGPGDIIYIPAHYRYRIDSGAEELIVIHFDLACGTENEIELFTPSDSRYFIDKFKSIYSAWSMKKSDSLYECKASVYKVLSRIISERYDSSRDMTEKKFSESVEYIHEHYTDKTLSVAFLAKSCNMSDTYYRKLFALKYGKTPLKYITSLRVLLAEELLQSGYYTVTETAEKCGFDSQNYFSSVIKKATGFSPSELKKRL